MEQFLGDANIVVVVLIALVLLLSILIVRLEFKFKKFLSGKNARTLEDTILALRADVSTLIKNRAVVEEYLADVERRLAQSVQGVGTIRFTPFKSSGSGQSFATAFLNEHGDGVVISTLHARDRMSVFAKPVKNHTSEFELTQEEKEALKQARPQTKG